jgi:hypothetical protein
LNEPVKELLFAFKIVSSVMSTKAVKSPVCYVQLNNQHMRFGRTIPQTTRTEMNTIHDTHSVSRTHKVIVVQKQHCHPLHARQGRQITWAIQIEAQNTHWSSKNKRIQHSIPPIPGAPAN